MVGDAVQKGLVQHGFFKPDSREMTALEDQAAFVVTDWAPEDAVK